MSDRFRETAFLGEFTVEMLVVCPRCSSCARVAPADPAATAWNAPRKLTCPSCGHSRSWAGDSITRTFGAPPLDDYFELPLWIQTPCCGHILWAYNWSHLEHIARYVEATHRERQRDESGWSNRALTARLPRWIKSASHREQVLVCVRRLRESANAS